MATMAPLLLERESKSTDTMRALVFHGPNQIAIENVPVPRAGIGEAVIRVTLTTICGTDIHIVKGNTKSVRASSLDMSRSA
jgi:threonine dehydrogenase-like Zn-dependent dehydrogenase